jgi:uncharacterized protein YbjT (DUF2867 family)
VRVAVVGGTGTVGRPLVEALRRAGHGTVVLSRSEGIDVLNGSGLESALSGVDAVVDVTSTPAHSAHDAERFFATATDRLMTAERRAGVPHHVVLSVVGVDRVAGPPLWAGKRAQEERALNGPVPATVLRTTQFHDLATAVVAETRSGERALVPPLLVQPVAVTDVALVLAETAVGPPQRRARELAGPATEDLVDMARRAFAARSEHLELVPSWRGVPYGVEMAGEVLLPGPDARIAPTTFDDWLLESWLAA